VIVLIIYYFQWFRIIIVVIHAFRHKKKWTFKTAISDMSSFFIFCTSQSIIFVAYNLNSSSHFELEFFNTKKHYNIIFRSDMLINLQNEILQRLKNLFVWRRK
jgi:hypothetical protein